jgi:serine/threonine protein kinase
MNSHTSFSEPSENNPLPLQPEILVQSSVLRSGPPTSGPPTSGPPTAEPPTAALPPERGAQGREIKIPEKKISSPHRVQLDSEGSININIAVPASALTLGSLLKRGGFGSVYKGIYKGQPVAIKQLHGDLTPEMVKELRQEAEIMFQAGLESDYIVRLKKICLEPPYSLVMELMPKGSLYDLLHNRQALPWTIRFRIALDAAWGLNDLHPKILHRDLKSLNILLDDRLRAKLADFGVAKVKYETSSLTLIAKGTPLWMAPELFDDEPKMTTYSDIYSFGMVLWELASRMLPYAKAPNQHVAVRWIEKGKKEEVPGDCPSELKSIIESCWETTPAKRPTAVQVVEKLKPLVEKKEPSGLWPASPAEDPREKEMQQLKVEIERLKLAQEQHSAQLAVATEEERWKESEKQKANRWLEEKHQAELKKHEEESRLILEPQATTASFSQPLLPTSQNLYNFLSLPEPEPWQMTELLLTQPMLEQPEPEPWQRAELLTKPTLEQIEKMLLYVAKGEQDKAEALLKHNPTLALEYGAVSDPGGRTFKRITAFQYAVWALDWHMWEMMLKKFTQVEHCTLLAAQQYQELDNKDIEHGQTFSLDPLISALQVYNDKYGGWTDEQRKKHWCEEVGQLQCQLPWNVVNEYCRPDRSFDPCPLFTEHTALPRGKGKENEWMTMELGYKLGENMAWARGSSSCCLYYFFLPVSDTSATMLAIDQDALAAMSQVRALQRKELSQKLKAKFATEQEQQEQPDITIPASALRLGRLLGKGSFGAVYAGELEGKPVAIKQLSTHLSMDAMKELKREAEIMFQLGLESDYIVRLKKICLEPPYSLVMELMPKGSLYDLLHNGQTLPWTIRYQIALDAAWGLKDLHAWHILHRDLKSPNILLDDRLRAKLADFGLAKVRISSQSSGVKGTILWVAPELFNDEPQMTVHSDIYSFGMVLWELASRRLPYAKAPNQITAARWIEKGKKEEIPSDCLPAFKSIIESCWESPPTKRPTALQVAEWLQPLVMMMTPVEQKQSLILPAAPVHKVLLQEGHESQDLQNQWITACKQGDEKVVEQFLKAGFSPNVEILDSDTNGLVPLLYVAAKAGHEKIAKYLLQYKATVDSGRKDGATPLLIAAAKGHMDTAKLLLDSKAGIDKAMTDGRTALYSAASNGHTETAKLLLEAKANINKKYGGGIFGKKPLKIAEEKGHTGVAEAIKQWSKYGRFFPPVTIAPVLARGADKIVKENKYTP